MGGRKKDFLNNSKYTISFLIILLFITFLTSERRINPTLVVAMISSLSIFFVQNILAKLKYTFWVTIVLIIILSFDVFFALVYRTYLTIFIIGSIFETDHIEAYEALAKFVIIAVIIIAAVSFFTIYSQKELKRNSPVSWKVSLLILLSYFIVVIPTATYIKLKRDNVSHNYISLDPLLTTESMLKTIIPVFYGDFSTFCTYQYRKWQLNTFLKQKRTLHKELIENKEKKLPENFFFVIGETARRDHMSLYGYSVKTTPFLDSLYQTKSIDFNFYNGVAPAPLTREALRIVLSFASPLDETPFYTDQNIVELTQGAGYTAYWISNHDKIALGDGYIGYISSKADFTSFRDRLHNGRLEDLNLLELVSMKLEKGKKQIFFIHLIGSHSGYDQRCDSIDQKAITGQGVVTDYDRSIFHTDRVLKGIYSLMKTDSSAVALYFSDHGEVIGKGHSMGWLQDYTVPFLVMSNDTTILNSEKVVNKYIDEETNLINTSSIIYIMSEILGYKISEKLVEKSKNDGKYVLNKVYLPEEFRYIKSYQEFP